MLLQSNPLFIKRNTTSSSRSWDVPNEQSYWEVWAFAPPSGDYGFMDQESKNVHVTLIDPVSRWEQSQ